MLPEAASIPGADVLALLGRCVAYKPGERPDLEEDIVPDLTELAIEADTYKGAGQSSTPRGTPSALICPLTQVLIATLPL